MVQSKEQDFSQYNVWLSLKLQEFKRMGYGKINEHDLWEYLTTYRWKRGRPDRYYQVVDAIMRITSNDYFTFETLKAQVYEVKSIDELDLDGLF